MDKWHKYICIEKFNITDVGDVLYIKKIKIGKGFGYTIQGYDWLYGEESIKKFKLYRLWKLEQLTNE